VVVIFATTKPLYEGHLERCNISTAILVFPAFTVSVCYLIVCVITAVLLRNVVDGFIIKWEMKYTGLVWLIGILAIIGIVTFNFTWDPWAQIDNIFRWVTYLACFPITVFFPVFRTFDITNRNNKNNRNNRNNRNGNNSGNLSDQSDSADNWGLEDILESETLCEAWEEFLAKEFALENHYFVLSVMGYEQNFSTTNAAIRCELAQNIFDQYIASGAVQEINIGAKTRSKLFQRNEDKFKNSTESEFYAAKQEIKELLMRDSLPRFYKTDAFKKFIKKKGQSSLKMESLKEKKHTETISMTSFSQEHV